MHIFRFEQAHYLSIVSNYCIHTINKKLTNLFTNENVMPISYTNERKSEISRYFHFDK